MKKKCTLLKNMCWKLELCLWKIWKVCGEGMIVPKPYINKILYNVFMSSPPQMSSFLLRSPIFFQMERGILFLNATPCAQTANNQSCEVKMISFDFFKAQNEGRERRKGWYFGGQNYEEYMIKKDMIWYACYLENKNCCYCSERFRLW